MENLAKPNMNGNFHDRQDHQFSSPQTKNNLEKASNYSLDKIDTDANNDLNAYTDEVIFIPCDEQLELFVEIESLHNCEKKETKEINQTPNISIENEQRKENIIDLNKIELTPINNEWYIDIREHPILENEYSIQNLSGNDQFSEKLFLKQKDTNGLNIPNQFTTSSDGQLRKTQESLDFDVNNNKTEKQKIEATYTDALFLNEHYPTKAPTPSENGINSHQKLLSLDNTESLISHDIDSIIQSSQATGQEYQQNPIDDLDYTEDCRKYPTCPNEPINTFGMNLNSGPIVRTDDFQRNNTSIFTEKNYTLGSNNSLTNNKETNDQQQENELIFQNASIAHHLLNESKAGQQTEKDLEPLLTHHIDALDVQTRDLTYASSNTEQSNRKLKRKRMDNSKFDVFKKLKVEKNAHNLIENELQNNPGVLSESQLNRKKKENETNEQIQLTNTYHNTFNTEIKSYLIKTHSLSQNANQNSNDFYGNIELKDLIKYFECFIGFVETMPENKDTDFSGTEFLEKIREKYVSITPVHSHIGDCHSNADSVWDKISFCLAGSNEHAAFLRKATFYTLCAFQKFFHELIKNELISDEVDFKYVNEIYLKLLNDVNNVNSSNHENDKYYLLALALFLEKNIYVYFSSITNQFGFDLSTVNEFEKVIGAKKFVSKSKIFAFTQKKIFINENCNGNDKFCFYYSKNCKTVIV